MKFADISSSETYKKAPQEGHLLAYTREKVKFQSYRKDNDMLKEILGDAEIVEIHLFDKDKEYRAILSKSRKSKAMGRDFIDCIVEKETDESCIYEQKYIIDSEYKKEGQYIIVANHLAYDEDGMSYIDGYRLVMPDKEA